MYAVGHEFDAFAAREYIYVHPTSGKNPRDSPRGDASGVQASARSIGPRRDKWIVLNILATASIAPDETDRADVARRWHGSIELTSAIAVAMQTGTASASVQRSTRST